MSYRSWLWTAVRSVFSAGQSESRRRDRRSGFAAEQLERRALLAAFSSSAQTVTLDLDVASQVVQIASTGTGYTFTLSGGATNTWNGTAGSGLSASGTVLTANATALSNFSLFKITDSAANTTANFSGSGTNAFNDNFEVTLDSLSKAVLFSGNSSFSGANGLSIVTDSRVELPSTSCLTMANGSLDMSINMQTTPQVLSFSGLMVNNATIQTTGTGLTNIVARGGVGAAASFLNKGVAVVSGGKILGGTTGTMNITGYGFTGVDGVEQGQGVFVYNANTSTNISTISSIGANVSVTGYGANSTNATLSSTGCMVNAGVVVGGQGTGGGTFCGTITSGGNGTVTVTGYGGTLANQAASQNHYAMGVYINGLNATITSGGAGLVTVLGTGGGANANTACGMGVQVNRGTITSGTNGSVLVNGTGCTTALSSSNFGVWVQGTVQGTEGKIAAGAGTGSTTVIGTGSGGGTAGSNNDGVNLSTTGTITAIGSGNVTVTGYGGTAGTGSSHRGINLTFNGTITSNGGSVLVTGYGGGSGSSVANYGVATTSNGTITAGGLGSVTVIGYGGNNNGTGTDNYGVAIESGGSGSLPGKVTSSGGNVVVTGTGGGGTANSANASSSSTNIGVLVNQGGFIRAGGSGTVDVTGYGGGRSPGATGATNYGVQLATANSTTANTAQFSCITSSGGAVNVTGFGGGGSGTDVKSTSASNHGVYVLQGAKISSGGNADVTVNGTGGGFGNSTSTGATNVGVVVCSTITITGLGETFSTITSGGNGNVTINGQGGGSGTGANQWGVAVQAGGLVTSGGTGNVSITGVGGYTSGTGAYGVVVQCVTTSNVSSTVTSGGGNVVIHGTGGGNNATTAYGVFVTVGAQIIAPGTASVTVTGRGGNANGTTGLQNSGVLVQTACSTNQARAKITSNNGTVTVTGYGGNTNTTLTNACGSNYGVYMSTGGEISAGGTAPVTVIGYGGGLTQGATSNNTGVCLTTLGTANLPTQITSSGGAVTVSGYGGGTNSNSASGLNFGLNIAGGAQISTTGSGTSINITGTGGGGGSASTNYGMQIQGCSTLNNITITSNGGPITLNATEGTGSSTRGIVTTANAVIGNATNPGNITISTNSAKFSETAGSAINSAGSLLIAPITSDVGVSLGGTTDLRGGPLTLSAAELNTMSAGTITLGNTNTGSYSVDADVTIPAAANLTLVSNSTSSTGIGSNLSTTISMAAGKTLNVSALPSLNTSIASATNHSQLNVVGNLSIAGKSLNLSGSYTPVSGDVYTVANATSLTGTFTGLANGSTTTYKNRTLIVNYTPTTVTLTEPSPKVITQPTSQTVTAGATVTFNAAATGIPTPGVQWQVLTPGGFWSNITNATSPTYSFTAAAGDNSNQYRAYFSNTYGDDLSTAVTLTVQYAPGITTQPTSQSISDGATATFTAAATGNPTPTVQWQVNTGSGWTDVTDGTGGTTTSYTTAAMSLAASGYQYRARFTNSVTANVETSAAVLTVTSGSSSTSPSITTQPTSQTVMAGATVTFIAAANGNPTPTAKWQVNTGSGWSDISGATSATYSFTTAAGDNAAQYRAVFTNGVGSDATTNAATLTVQYAPAVTTNPSSQTITAGATVTFIAAASGNPTPTVKWQVNTGSSWSDISGATSATYSFTSAAGDNGRQYRAVFTNGIGSDATTNAATLTVQYGPTVTTNPSSQTVTTGATATLTAAASGNPAPTVKWQVNTVSGWSDIVGATSTTYSFTAAAGDNAAQYRAVFTNGIGSDVATTAATLTVPALTTFTVSKGQAQRSFLRYLDVGTNSSATASALSQPGRVRLLKADLNGNGATAVPLTGFVSASGSTLAIDFGAFGLGASRNTNGADGYYTLGLDLDGDGNFETSRRFYRLLGDVNGDRQVNDTDVSLVTAGTTSPYNSILDTNGDGVVNASDMLFTTRAKGRKLADGLLLD